MDIPRLTAFNIFSLHLIFRIFTTAWRHPSVFFWYSNICILSFFSMLQISITLFYVLPLLSFYISIQIYSPDIFSSSVFFSTLTYCETHLIYVYSYSGFFTCNILMCQIFKKYTFEVCVEILFISLLSGTI